MAKPLYSCSDRLCKLFETGREGPGSGGLLGQFLDNLLKSLSFRRSKPCGKSASLLTLKRYACLWAFSFPLRDPLPVHREKLQAIRRRRERAELGG